ncbi:MAG: hypothetical protein KAH68_01335 [Draconibacterium sp.]|nr:hypothetical protein [Draconibacterium sp.]
MGENKGNRQPSVLILADFSDGSWHAVSFAMQFLFQNNSCFSVLQTYQKPNFGLFMLRNLIPHLKKITKHELKTLKTKILENYKVKSEKINTISLKGELNILLRKEAALKGPHNIVIGTHGSFLDSCTMQNNCLAKIIDRSTNPLFILPKMYNMNKNNKILFVGNTFKTPSQNMKNLLLMICKTEIDELELLFVVENKSQKMNEEVKMFFETHFKKIKHTINYVINTSVCKGTKSYIKNNFKDLIIVERTNLSD